MAKSLLNMDFHLIFGFSHFKLAFESIIQEELAIINDENIKNYVVESDFRKFYVISYEFRSLLSFGCDCVWKLVRVRNSAEIRSIVRMNEL